MPSTFLELVSPRWWISFLHRTRYLHYFAVGMSGVGINLGITVVLTEFLFGRDNYFTAYLIGLSVALVYNFTLHTMVTFKSGGNHATRLVYFLAYSLSLTYVQARVVKYLTGIFGVDWYVIVIASVIMVFSVVTFVLFKFILFKAAGTTPKESEETKEA